MKKIFMATLIAVFAIASVANADGLNNGTSFSGPSQYSGGSPLGGSGVLYDNGPTDAVNGYSNANANVFGARRTILDDFVVPVGETWTITDFHWQHVWGTPGIGLVGTGAFLEFLGDLAGTPDIGNVLGSGNINQTYSSVDTGNIAFSREVIDSSVTFDPVVLTAGTYWFQAHIEGPENNFWLINSVVNNNEMWVNYDDLGGLQDGTTAFGVATDANFRITGTRGIIPEPTLMGVLALGALAFLRRRR